MGESRNGYGVYGVGNNNVGVWGTSRSTGVWGDLTDSGIAGVVGRTLDPKSLGRGLYGQVQRGRGEAVFGEIVPNDSTAAAIRARTNGSGPGILAESKSGRGIIASSAVAQMQLKPSRASSHPARGQPGDMFVDKNVRLWFCTRGGKAAKWVRLA